MKQPSFPAWAHSLSKGPIHLYLLFRIALGMYYERTFNGWADCIRFTSKLAPLQNTKQYLGENYAKHSA